MPLQIRTKSPQEAFTSPLGIKNESKRGPRRSKITLKVQQGRHKVRARSNKVGTRSNKCRALLGPYRFWTPFWDPQAAPNRPKIAPEAPKRDPKGQQNQKKSRSEATPCKSLCSTQFLTHFDAFFLDFCSKMDAKM